MCQNCLSQYGYSKQSEGSPAAWADIGYMEGYQEHLSLRRPNRKSPRGLRMRCESKMSTELDVSDK